jgi:ferritin heavy chain
MEWKSARNALETAFQMEKEINKSLLALHQVAEQQNDPQFCDFLESEFLNEQVESIKKLADMLTQLNRVGNDGLGLFLFDKELQ